MDTPRPIKTSWPWGDIPKRSSCPANNNGYGPHETTATAAVMYFSSPPDANNPKAFSMYPCKHCGSFYGVSK